MSATLVQRLQRLTPLINLGILELILETQGATMQQLLKECGLQYKSTFHQPVAYYCSCSKCRVFNYV